MDRDYRSAFLLLVQMWITICLSLLSDNVCLWIDFFFNNCLNPPPIFTLKLFQKFCTFKGVGVARVSRLCQP